MYFSKEDDACFNIQDLYASAQQIVKRIVVKIGTAVLALYICTGVGYAQEVVLPSVIKDIPVIEMTSTPPTSAMAFDVKSRLIINRPFVHDSSSKYALLMNSLMAHKGGEMSSGFYSSFEELAVRLSTLPFVDTLARYSKYNNYVSITLAFDKGIELEVTQMPDVEDVAFSILHDGETMMVATATVDLLTERMQHLLNEMSVNHGVS